MEYKRTDGKNAKKYEKTIIKEHKCVICGDTFTSKAWNSKICSKVECQIENTLRVRATLQDRIKNGEVCSKLITREFKCERCESSFTKETTPRKKLKYCDECTTDIKREQREVDYIQKDIKLGTIGKGNNQWGKNNHMYKNGDYSIFDKMPEIMGVHNHRKEYERHFKNNDCYFCGIIENDILHDIHHKDNNHQNNSPDNLMKLCRSCHKKIHYLYSYLGIESKDIFK